jgi:hypothetical protein
MTVIANDTRTFVDFNLSKTCHLHYEHYGIDAYYKK